MHTIVFAGGGTAGHIIPNFALIDELKTEFNCVYVGGDGMEKSLCASRGIPFYTVPTVKFRRDALYKNFGVPFKLHTCVKAAKQALSEIKPVLIFSKGGYAALPVALAAKDIPLLSHESDFSPGLTTKLCKRKSEKVLCAFKPCAEKFKNGVHVGTPLCKSLYRGVKSKAAYGLSGNKPVLTVIGGSSGAAALNEITVASLPLLLEKFDVIHMTGKNKAGAPKQDGYCPIEFENNMARLYATSDVVLSRAGANALGEVIALKIPTVAVPLEKASRGDQLQNAEYYEKLGAINVVHEKELSPEKLMTILRSVHDNRHKYIAAMSSISVDGTDEICRIIKELIAN